MKQEIYTNSESRFVVKIVTTDVINAITKDKKEVYFVPMINKDTSRLTVVKETLQNHNEVWKVTVSAPAIKKFEKEEGILTNDGKYRSFFDDLEVIFYIKKGTKIETELDNDLLELRLSTDEENTNREYLFGSAE